jgi:non-ribosomal peptide synthetase component F
VRRGNKLAVVAPDGRLTFAELNQRADDVAHCLAERGVTQGSIVALGLDRSIDMPVAALAALRCGAAYLPLALADPSSRLLSLIARIKPAVILTNSRVSGLFDDAASRLVYLDEIQQTAAEVTSGREPLRGARPGDLAYVLATSGTLGTPKLVTVSCKVLDSYVRSLLTDLDVCPDDICLHTAAWSFSAAIRQMWLPLCAGATLVIADESTCRDPEALFGHATSEGQRLGYGSTFGMAVLPQYSS